jgi:sulfur relay (sulfurtransferase) DsrC/TusE family protein
MSRLFDRDQDAFVDHYDSWEAQVNDHIAQNDPIGTATVVVRT